MLAEDVQPHGPAGLYADLPTVPDNVGGRFSAFSAAGRLPAALMGLDGRALLLGASAMTKRFLEEPFERNPVLQFAGVKVACTANNVTTTRRVMKWGKLLRPVCGQSERH